MASGNTTTTALTDSLPTVIAAARQVREYKGIITNLVDKVTLDTNTGLDWNEISLAKLTASAVSETTEMENPQQISDTKFTITPTVVGILTVVTDRVAKRISKAAYAKIGSLGQNAIQRKKDEDGIVVLDGATTSLCGTGVTLTAGYIAAAKVRISSNTTEPGNPPYYCVLHGYQIKDLEDELVAAVGTYNISEGPTADVFKNGFDLPVAGVTVYEDGNITLSGTDAKGGVFAKDAIVLVQGRTPWARTIRNEKYGGGATEMVLYDEYAYGERSPGNWLYEIYSDATTPTS